MSTQTEGKALIEQTVTVDFTVHIEAAVEDLEVLTMDDLQARIEKHIRTEFLGSVISQAVADVTARRGPGGYRYFPPEARAEGYRWSKPDDRAEQPLDITLEDLGYEKES